MASSSSTKSKKSTSIATRERIAKGLQRNVQFSEENLEICQEQFIDFRELKANGQDWGQNYLRTLEMKRYFDLLNGPTNPNLRGQSRSEMGLKEFTSTEIRSNIAGLDVAISIDHIDMSTADEQVTQEEDSTQLQSCRKKTDIGEVEPCTKVPADVRYQMKQNLEEGSNKKRKIEEKNGDVIPTNEDGGVVAMDVEQSRPSQLIASQKVKSISRVDNYFMPRTTPGAQPTLKSVLQSKEVVEKCDLAIAKWFIDACVPFNASNSSYFQPVVDALSSMSPGYKVPTMHSLRGSLLNKWVDDANKLIEEYRDIWKKTGSHCINLMLQDMGKLEKVSGRESLRPDLTRFATNFIDLQSILAQKNSLRTMITSKEWTKSAYAKEAKAKRFVDQVLDPGFWTKCAEIVKIVEPLVRVLRIVDNEEKPAMGYIYKAFIKAKEDMVQRFPRNKKKVEPYLNIIHKRWDSQLRKNLHAVSEMRIFKDGDSDFGRKSVVAERSIVRADEWWETYGTAAPNLIPLAVRVLSQTCSASCCERNSSVFEHIHSKKRNRLEQKLNDLVFVRYNLRLQTRKKRQQNYDPINVETFGEHSNWVLEDSPPLLSNEEVEELRNNIANMTIQPLSSDIDQLNLDEDEDEDVAIAQDNTMANPNIDENNHDVEGEGDWLLGPWSWVCCSRDWCQIQCFMKGWLVVLLNVLLVEREHIEGRVVEGQVVLFTDYVLDVVPDAATSDPTSD
ncbi:hypothetical protein TSUD_395710 [Trifolium subterraneum]|uniref:HAT C-terminal dimerisation domain-containing protein n=1 Tax=Trifolium subterraneum TaxID=3900 RepID=A0A2Z6P631_TRISU|nr:hypothetical protein TSUD_395710 [Trifolium subterraneum]